MPTQTVRELEMWEGRLTRLKGQLDTLQAQVKKDGASLHQQAVEKCKKQLKEISDLRDTIKPQQQKLAERRSELDELSAELNQLSKELSQKKSEIVVGHQNLDLREKSLKADTQTLQTDRNAQVRHRDSENATFKQRNKQLEIAQLAHDRRVTETTRGLRDRETKLKNDQEVLEQSHSTVDTLLDKAYDAKETAEQQLKTVGEELTAREKNVESQAAINRGRSNSIAEQLKALDAQKAEQEKLQAELAEKKQWIKNSTIELENGQMALKKLELRVNALIENKKLKKEDLK